MLVEDGQVFQMGSIEIEAIHTPGHTPACTCFLVNKEFLFSGDALFMPDFGTGRCDFPDGSAKDLYHSIHEKIYKLPDETAVFVGHDYQPGGRPLKFQTSVGESKKMNIQLKEVTKEEDFIQFREERDRGLKAPKLLLASIQINLQNGKIPDSESNGTSYLKIPIYQQ